MPRPPLRTLTKTIDLTKANDMVNHTKFIRTLTLFYLSNNAKRWLSACLKGRTATFRYNFTPSPFFILPQGVCISPNLFSFFVSTFPQSDNFLTNFYADNFTVSCSNSNVDQMAEALSAHSSIIEE